MTTASDLDLASLPTIGSAEELTALIGAPDAAVRDKAQPALVAQDREFLAASPVLRGHPRTRRRRRVTQGRPGGVHPRDRRPHDRHPRARGQ
ncbi:hypothetical protein GCM10025872_22580 [Barrientosiimonas endolithica]|uniref:FXSXX-COOH protein n=1 Tax=Barrientosiimonas endolithica TaxID=1535208 RepID=A0ABN6YNM3_9MICO|nr:hypothetical protein GCM10025872_22580 [Barrientosiimonas endolithica]